MKLSARHMPELALEIDSPRNNQLLGAMSAQEYARWLPRLEQVTLNAGQVVFDMGVPRTHAYFPVTAVLSVQCVMRDGNSCETAIVGREGLVGLALFLGARFSKNRVVTLCSGTSYRVSAEDMKLASESNSESLRIFLSFTGALLVQITQLAACSRHHKLEQQFCRWLLQGLDRGTLGELAMTHEFIANMIGVRRESISEIAHHLQALQLIRSSRGRLIVLNRAGIERLACECYQIISSSYRDILVPYFSPEDDRAVPRNQATTAVTCP